MRLFSGIDGRSAFELEGRVGPAVAWEVGGHADHLNAGQRLEASFQLLVERDLGWRGWILAGAQEDVHAHEMVGADAHGRVGHFEEAADHEPGSDEQHEGQRHFSDDEKAGEMARAGAGAGAVAAVFEHQVDIET